MTAAGVGAVAADGEGGLAGQGGEHREQVARLGAPISARQRRANAVQPRSSETARPSSSSSSLGASSGSQTPQRSRAAHPALGTPRGGRAEG